MFFKTVNNSSLYWTPLISLCFLITSCELQSEMVIKRTQFIMGTLIEITVQEPDKDLANKAIDKSFDEISRLENIMSTYLPNSELSKLNISAGNKKKIPVSPELLNVIQRGIHWGKLSSGAIDISIGPAANLWEFDTESPTIPDKHKLLNAVSLIDYKNISIEDGSINLNKPGMSLNLGAMGKGYAVDRAVYVLKKMGIKSGLVNAGGDLMAFGSKKATKSWRVGLQHPRNPEQMIASLDISNKAVATSGDYQRYFIKDKIRYHHILNPKDGWPANQVMLATVIADKVVDADALSTALFVLGAKKGINLINSLEGIEGMILSDLGSASFSSGFRSLPGLSLQHFKEDLSQ